MDTNSLFCSLELVAGSGHTLNVEQRTALETSSAILKRNYKFHRVLLWGKILGLRKDYFIVQGRGEDEIKDRKNLYSFNCVDWFVLPTATDSMIEEVSKLGTGQFIGDPSFVYEINKRAEGPEAVEEEGLKVTEETRLAVTVHQIDEEASVVPRGAFVRSPHSLVQINRSFGGLSDAEANKLHNYLHFREAKNVKEKSILEMGDLNPALDFLDVLSDDIPKGSWSLQFECARKVCVLRSLLWLGLTFYHVPMTQQHGYIYTGDGTKNLNLPFML
ncbi:radial spoke head protein 9 homolog [Parambassis ranga]|uniref:Radial spoke head protein 9 homolog n=1 Tax=Parambassis ranga TaxID=210632 RepID=A0A6P7HC64_9TELE|nr:radial spoke head protein 9 homolog [Parambassis ranga]